MLRMRLLLAIAAGGLGLLALRTFAAERVTLRNGFQMQCDHHAQVADRVRLYMGAGESSYIELRPEEVIAVEVVKLTSPSELAVANSDAKADAKLSRTDLHEILSNAGREHNLDVDLLASVVKAESDGNEHAISPKGARGLMQLMPSTATDLGVEDSFKASDNVRGGSAYLDGLLTRYHDNLALALAAYNAGPAAVDKYHGVPPYHQTRAYVARVIHEFNRRVIAREAQAHAVTSKPANSEAANRAAHSAP